MALTHTLAAAAAERPEALMNVTQAINLVVLLTAVVVLARELRGRSTAATRWALTMFALFAVVVSAGMLEIEPDGSVLLRVYTVLIISVLLLIPYALVRFAYALGVIGRRSHLLAAALTVAQIGVTAALPSFPQPGEDRPAWYAAWIVLILGGWTVQSVLSAVGLWRAGRGQPSVVRHRMRALSLGAMVIVVALLASGTNGEGGGTTQVVTTLLGVVGVAMMVLAFVVPGWLRSAWRAADLVELGQAERRLMTAITADDVAIAIVPAVIKLFGANGATLLNRDGEPLEARGLTPEALARLRESVRINPPAGFVGVLEDGSFTCRLSEGWLVVEAGVFAPLFGAAELSMLDRVGSFVDLALQRCRLFEQEAVSRHAAEAANAELQTLVYSVSHDLRNPIISVLGYLDVLTQEHAGELQGEGQHYLERISVNAMYMQNLIQDLLELSRIGRSEPAPQPVELAALAESVAQEVRVMHPGCEVTVSGSLPVVYMSELRARQLLSNLIDNAAKHSVGEPRVSVLATRGENGGATVLVTDNGRGIPEQYREKAFDVFERLEAARSDIPGTGMGLPICKRIVESLHGTISLEGPAPGRSSGTTVKITLPADVVRSWTDVTEVAAPHKENAR